MIIYIAGRYNAPTAGEKLFNTHKAIDAGIQVYKKGHYPVIPHLTHWIDERMDYINEPPRTNDFWYKYDNMIIPRCDALFKISSSKGADAEEELAKKLGLHLYYRLEDIPYERNT